MKNSLNNKGTYKKTSSDTSMHNRAITLLHEQ